MLDFKEFRKKNNLSTQKKCAEYFGVSQAFISQIEKGIRPVPDAFISKIKADKNVTLNIEPIIESPDSIIISKDAWDLIREQNKIILSQQKTIEALSLKEVPGTAVNA